MDRGAWWAAVHGVAKSWAQLSDFSFTFHFHALEKAMATHSSVLAWRIPETEEPSGLPSMWSHRVRHDWSDLEQQQHVLELLLWQGSLWFPWFCLIATKTWSDGQTSVTAPCNFLRGTSVTAQFYLESKGKCILEAWEWADPKDTKRSPWPNFGTSFYMFFFFFCACPR